MLAVFKCAVTADRVLKMKTVLQTPNISGFTASSIVIIYAI